jgi:plasmid stabilization system protein ParE
MRYAVVITEIAAAEMVEQFEYIRDVQNNSDNAERWLKGVYAAVEALEQFAGHARAPESDFLDFDLRHKIFKSHRIIYSVDAAKKEVTIHSVRHGARRGIGEPPRTDPAE